jgi:hypothetical protein
VTFPERLIVEGESRRPLGFVRRRLPNWGWQRLRLWNGWLDVFETQDASLLFTVRRRWGFTPTWNVRDADRHRIGSLFVEGRRWLLRGREGRQAQGAERFLVADRAGGPFARVERFEGSAPARMLGVFGEELGRWFVSPEGTQLEFAASESLSPFAKMSLLAAVLTADTL